ncbi:SpoIIE family protein phosphatase [Streptomyces sp. NPDC057702]|uniref:SpoIIE family protein phosphatase n=1 Tax=unclassified Streptomyces TaxID=2593676 RepID=UPI0036B6E6BD
MPAGAGTPDGTEIAPISAPMWQSGPPGSLYDHVQVASFSIGPDGRVEQWSERAAELLGVSAQEAIGRDPVEVFVPRELREQGHRKIAELLDGREWTGLVPYLRPERAPAPDAARPHATAPTPAPPPPDRPVAGAPAPPPAARPPAADVPPAAPEVPALPGQRGAGDDDCPHFGTPGATATGRTGDRDPRYGSGDEPYGLAEIYLMPARNELGERSALCIAVDVGALRQIETDLAASQAVFGQSPLGFFFTDTRLRLVRVNESFARAFGRPVAWHRGRNPYDFLPRGEADRFSASLRRVIETGTPVTGMQIVGTRYGESERHRWQVSFYRLHAGSGRPIGVAGLVIDITGRRRAEQEAAGVRRNLALLNEAGARIGTSLDLETTARELLAVAVPQFCDLASVDLYQGLLVGDEAAPELWAATRGSGSGRGRAGGSANGSAPLRRVAFASAVSDGPVALSGYPVPEPDDLAGPIGLGIPGAASHATAPGPAGPGPDAARFTGAEATDDGPPPGARISGGPLPARTPGASGPGPRAYPGYARATDDAHDANSPLGPRDKSDDGEPNGQAGPYGPGDARSRATYPSRARRAAGRRPVQVGEVHRYAPHSPCATALSTAQVRVIPGRDGGGDPDAGPELGAVVQSTLAVPMVARDTVVGLAQFSRTKGSEPFGERDTALAVELAARAAVSIDNARLYRREHERALILQHSLLPPGAPEAAGLDIACRYLPGSEATEVGGDWYDVIELPGHRTALVVGDVMGRGLRAAVAMGELRTAVRTLAMLDLEPAEVMTALDEIAHGLGAPGTSRSAGSRGAAGDSDLSEIYLATCVYAVYDPVTRRCTIANAGHLPPVLVPRGGPPRLVELPPGMPLGVGGEPFEEKEFELPDGALLALYTDGLVESRDHSLDVGLDALRAALTDPPVTPEDVNPLESLCDHVLNALDTHHGEDDTALLMARTQGLPAASVGDWRLPREPRSVGLARELACHQLREWGLEPLVDTAELLVSELVTNALRYGEMGVPPAKQGGEIRVRLLLDRNLVCEVWDSGLVQPRRRRARDTDEGGRGLQLVGLLSAAWGSRRTPRGKTVWFELPLPSGEASGVDASEALLSMF